MSSIYIIHRMLKEQRDPNQRGVKYFNRISNSEIMKNKVMNRDINLIWSQKLCGKAANGIKIETLEWNLGGPGEVSMLRMVWETMAAFLSMTNSKPSALISFTVSSFFIFLSPIVFATDSTLCTGKTGKGLLKLKGKDFNLNNWIMNVETKICLPTILQKNKI